MQFINTYQSGSISNTEFNINAVGVMHRSNRNVCTLLEMWVISKFMFTRAYRLAVAARGTGGVSFHVIAIPSVLPSVMSALVIPDRNV